MKRMILELHAMWRELRDPYRPELHYMRGPGPRSLGRTVARPMPMARPDPTIRGLSVSH